MTAIIEIKSLNKTYAGGFEALKDINLQIDKGEIFALLGPNGAGKTTLINIICGIVQATSGTIHVDGYEINRDYRRARALIGLVPQELTTDAFETVWDTTSFSRGVFGKPPNPEHIEATLKSLALWEKKDSKIMTLSGGMKRRVLIAKALSHEPRVLFLDEPTAGVDVELRKGMWEVVHRLQASGVTIILTTHYIEEAEEMAGRVGVINNGEIILVQEKRALMTQLGTKQIVLQLNDSIDAIPSNMSGLPLVLAEDGLSLAYTYDTNEARTGITQLLSLLSENEIRFKDLETINTSLEDIFVNLVRKPS